jgi:hypothetical protein
MYVKRAKVDGTRWYLVKERMEVGKMRKQPGLKDCSKERDVVKTKDDELDDGEVEREERERAKEVRKQGKGREEKR